MEALAACTGASTVCGSCRPLLCELVGALARQEPAEGYRALIGLSLAVCLGALWFALAPPVDFSETVQGIWHLIDALWRDNVLKQISGYSLLTAVLLTLSLSLRKRWQRVRFGDFASWRVAHIILGLLALLLLVAHTGFRLGENLNFMLMVSFLAVSLSGAAMAGLVAVEHRLDRAVARRLRSGCAWLHLLMLWPLPVLLVFHIVSVYYF